MKQKKAKPFSVKGYRDDDVIPLGFDTETDGLGGRILLLTACDWDGTHVFGGENIIHQFIEHAQNWGYPAVWYAHHAQYDWRAFIDYIRDSQIPCEISMRTETDIYQITLFVEGAKIVMRDSMALFPGTLEQFARSFTPELPKLQATDIAHFDPTNPEDIEYAKRDAEILRYGMPRLNALLQKHFNISAGHTTAGTALKAWQATIPEGVYYPVSEIGNDESFIRGAYYGGLSFLTRTDEIQGAVTFDINSSYPDSMCRHGVPWGKRTYSRDYESGKMGIYSVRVRAPDDLIIPILPHRNAQGYMRWHRGVFDTTVTNAELIFAVNNGYEVLDVFEGVVFEDRIFPFNVFIENCKRIRREYKGLPEETLAKLIQNSLYGKMGSRRERMRVFVPRCEEDILDALPLDDAEYFWIKKEVAEKMRCIPEWAVFITAHSRLHLLSQAYKCGPENVINGDTDSLTVLPTVAHLFDIGEGYGQWKREKDWASFRAIAPKVYAGQLSDGKWKGAAKGLPKKKMGTPEWRGLFTGDLSGIEYDSLSSLRVSIKQGMKPAKTIMRRVTDINNSANWELNNGRVAPRLAACPESFPSLILPAA